MRLEPGLVLQDALLNAFVTFFVTIDPPGLMGIFLALTTGMTSKQRRQTALRGTLIGIKGQYLVFDTGVINLRRFTSYEIEVTVSDASAGGDAEGQLSLL